jgi:hypothetical protein
MCVTVSSSSPECGSDTECRMDVLGDDCVSPLWEPDGNTSARNVTDLLATLAIREVQRFPNPAGDDM